MDKLINLFSRPKAHQNRTMRPFRTLALSHAAMALYRPAEWAQHSGVIMAWPSSENESYDAKSLKATKKDISAIASAVALFEPITFLVEPSVAKDAEKKFRSSRNRIDVVPLQNHRHLDLWTRDMAPTFVLDEGHLAGVDYNFNGWGAKHAAATPPCTLASAISGMLNVPRVSSSLITEGGSLEVDGQGTLLITRSSILNANRNPGKSQIQVEQELRRTLGVEKIIWLPGRTGLDVTDWHVDGLARFVAPGKVVLSRPAKSTTKGDVTMQVYNEARDILARSTDAKGRRIEVVEMEEADLYSVGLDRETIRRIEDGDEDAPALTYVNYLLVNGGVVFPQFGDGRADRAALKAIQAMYGDRDVEPVYLNMLPYLGGGIHCATQEIPVDKTGN